MRTYKPVQYKKYHQAHNKELDALKPLRKNFDAHYFSAILKLLFPSIRNILNTAIQTDQTPKSMFTKTLKSISAFRNCNFEQMVHDYLDKAKNHSDDDKSYKKTDLYKLWLHLIKAISLCKTFEGVTHKLNNAERDYFKTVMSRNLPDLTNDRYTDHERVYALVRIANYPFEPYIPLLISRFHNDKNTDGKTISKFQDEEAYHAWLAFSSYYGKVATTDALYKIWIKFGWADKTKFQRILTNNRFFLLDGDTVTVFNERTVLDNFGITEDYLPLVMVRPLPSRRLFKLCLIYTACERPFIKLSEEELVEMSNIHCKNDDNEFMAAPYGRSVLSIAKYLGYAKNTVLKYTKHHPNKKQRYKIVIEKDYESAIEKRKKLIQDTLLNNIEIRQLPNGKYAVLQPVSDYYDQTYFLGYRLGTANSNENDHPTIDSNNFSPEKIEPLFVDNEKVELPNNKLKQKERIEKWKKQYQQLIKDARRLHGQKFFNGDRSLNKDINNKFAKARELKEKIEAPFNGSLVPKSVRSLFKTLKFARILRISKTGEKITIIVKLHNKSIKYPINKYDLALFLSKFQLATISGFNPDTTSIQYSDQHEIEFDSEWMKTKISAKRKK